MKAATRLATCRPAAGDPWNATAPPLYQTATFAQASALEAGAFDYTRSGNPTRRALEERIAELEGAPRALAYGSGIAALAAVTRVVASGGTVLAGDDLYGGSYRLLSRWLARQGGIEVRYADLAGAAEATTATAVATGATATTANGTADAAVLGGPAAANGSSANVVTAANGPAATVVITAADTKTPSANALIAADGSAASNAAAALTALAARPGPRLVLVETPTNPLLRIADLRALADMAHAAGALLAVDNSLLSPYLQRPLELGADIVVHSATKCLSGHGDVTAGVVAVRDEALAAELAFAQNAEGTALAPFEAWLLLRGLKTLVVRLDRQEANAHRIAEHLARRDDVLRLRYPGLPGHPGRALQLSQAAGCGSVISFETGSVERSRRLAEAARLFAIAVSFGSVSSQISLPCRMSHASIPAEVRRARALPEDLVRLAIGIEDAGDLIADLDQALDECRLNDCSQAECDKRRVPQGRVPQC